MTIYRDNCVRGNSKQTLRHAGLVHPMVRIPQLSSWHFQRKYFNKSHLPTAKYKTQYYASVWVFLNILHPFSEKKQQKRPLQKMHFLQCNSLYQRISTTKFPQLPFSLSPITFPDYVILYILSQFMLCLAKKHCLSFSSTNLGCLSVNISVLYRAVTDHSLTVIYFKPC